MMTKTFQEIPHVHVWKPLVYRNWKEVFGSKPTTTSGKIKQSPRSSASSGSYRSITWDSSTRAEQTPGRIKTDALISCCAPPLPPAAVTQTVVTACWCKTWLLLGSTWRGCQESYDLEGLTEFKSFHSVLWTRWGWVEEQRWNENKWLGLNTAAAQAGTWEQHPT